MRISESLEMRKNIQKLGILVIDEIREEIKDIFNDYVKYGTNGTICNKKINISPDMSIIITLNSEIDFENGIVLEQ